MKFHSPFPLLHPHWDYKASASTILYTAIIQLRLLDVLHAQGSEAEIPILTDKNFLLWLSHPHRTPWMIGESPQPVIWPLQRGREKLSRGKGCLQPPFSRLVSVQRAEWHKSNSPSPAPQQQPGLHTEPAFYTWQLPGGLS